MYFCGNLSGLTELRRITEVFRCNTGIVCGHSLVHGFGRSFFVSVRVGISKHRLRNLKLMNSGAVCFYLSFPAKL